MNNYRINAPYSHKRGDKYIKLEIQQYGWNKSKGRTDRTSKMYSFRVDLDASSTMKPEDLYLKVKGFLSNEGYID